MVAKEQFDHALDLWRLWIMDKISTRSDLALLVPAGETVIELGVAKGDFAHQMLRANPAINYIGVDKWDDHHDSAEMMEAKAKIEAWGKSHQIIHATFADALNKIDDESAFLVYVDGYAHTGQDGGRTLWDWWPKVKSGGIFAGHDYCTQYPQTIDAVNHFVQIIQSEGCLTDLRIISDSPYDSWAIRKPE